MTNTDLLHQYFDEGLDPEREDALFSALAADAQLRREFSEHVRLHAFIQNDIRAVTTPAAVTTALFAGLGIATATAVSTAAAGAQTASHAVAAQTAGKSVHVLRSVMPHVFTSLATVVLSSVLFFSYFPRAVEQQFLKASTSIVPTPDSHETAVDNTTAASSSQTGQRSVAANGIRQFSEPTPAATTSDGNPPPEQEPVVPEVNAPALPDEVFSPVTVSFAGEIELDADNTFAATGADPGAAPETVLATEALPFFSDSFVSPPPYLPWKAHFFAYHEGGSFLSNLVFEMRVLNSRSHPSVDLPYNSHDLFKDMAISAVYKVSDIHAFGLEYGRETFGQEFQSMTPSDEVAAREPIRVVYTPPAPWIPAVVQRNKMLDWYGAVWKLSLPQLGVMDFVYPYARTMLGATKQGPLAKMRFGLEMYPTNYSMFNLGLEGSLLNYSFEGSWYKTYKLGVTFGVAVGF